MCREVDDADARRRGRLHDVRSPNHETSDDRPVASRLADWAEMRQLVRVLGDLDTGVFDWPTSSTPRRGAAPTTTGACTISRSTPVAPSRFVVGVTGPTSPHAAPAPRARHHRRHGRAMVGQTPPPRAPGRALVPDHASLRPAARVARATLATARCAGRPAPRPPRSTPARSPPRAGWVRTRHRRRGTAPRLRLDPRPRCADTSVPHRRRRRGDGASILTRDDRPRASIRPRAEFLQPFGTRTPPSCSDAAHPHTVVATATPARTCRRSSTRRSLRTCSPLGAPATGDPGRDRHPEAHVRSRTRVSGASSDRGFHREGFITDLNVFDLSTVGPAMPDVAYDFPTARAGSRRARTESPRPSSRAVRAHFPRDGAHTGDLPGPAGAQPSCADPRGRRAPVR